MTDFHAIAKRLAPFAPAVAGLIAGPGGAAVATGLVKALGLTSPDQLADLPPDRLTALDDAAKELRLAEIKSDESIALAQIANNTQDSKSASKFVAGWRPAIGWICGFGLAYQFIARPLGNAAVVIYKKGPFLLDGTPYEVFPAIDTASLSALLIGMLGLGVKRTVEKIRGVARNNLRE